MKLYLEDSMDLELKAFIKDLDGNYLDYESSYIENVVTISSIKEENFNIVAGAYRIEEENYYSETMYYLNSFDVRNPSLIDLDRVEILNMSYTIDGETIPTLIYFGGYLTANDSFDVVAYDEYGEELTRISNITDLSLPVIFNGLPTDGEVTFKYFLNHRGNIINESSYITSLSIPEEYLYIDYGYYYANPGDGLMTYNDDHTFNYYVYSGFENNSNYDLVYKVELALDMIPKYEYTGIDAVAEITNIGPNEYYSVIHKVMVREGKNYYAISTFYLASGSVCFEYTENEEMLYSYIDIYSNDDKTYTISSYITASGMINAEVILSTGEIINYEFDYEELYYGKIIDLSNYQYEGLSIRVIMYGNLNYGMGDIILETGIEYKGNLYLELKEEYKE